jgi:hypothetical protein
MDDVNALVEAIKRLLEDARDEDRTVARGLDETRELVVSEGRVYETEGALRRYQRGLLAAAKLPSAQDSEAEEG